MKSIVYLVLVMMCTAWGWGQRTSATTPQSEAPNVSSPIGRSPTQIPADKPYERTPLRPNAANDITTGNVTGGREFRGTLPYTPANQISTPLTDPGSVSVRSFLRRSAGLPSVSGPGSSSQPYYDPMLATTRTYRAGELSGLSKPMITTPTSMGRVSVPQLTDLQRMSQPQRPAWQETTELNALIMQQMGLRELALLEDEVNKLDTAQLQRLNPQIRQLLEPDTSAVDIASKPRERLFDESLRPAQPDKPVDPTQLTEADRQRIQKEQYEQMRKELEMLLEPDAERKTEPKPKTAPDAKTFPQSNSPDKTKSALPPLPSYLATNTSTTANQTTAAAGTASGPFRLPSPAERTRIRQLLGPYQDVKALSAARSEDYLRQAEQHMIQREYYRAADAYTLACVWEDNNPEVYLKKAIALFAAGAYLDSAKALQQSLTLQPERAGQPFDILAHLGGPAPVPNQDSAADTLLQKENRDLYESRMIEMAKWQQLSDSGLLALLMSYLHHQNGKDDEAKSALEIAVHYYPKDPAVIAMQKVFQPDPSSGKVAP